MARNRLTWQNVAAPDYGTAVQAQAQAHRMFQDAIGGLSSSIGSYAQQQEAARQQQMGQEQAAAEAAVLRGLAGASGNTEAQANILRSLGGNSQVSNDFLENQLTAVRNSMLSGDTASANLGQTKLTNERANSDAALMDRFRPTAGTVGAYVASGGSDPFKAMSPEQRSVFNALPAEEQTRLINAWSSEESQARDRSEHSLDQMARELAFNAQASGLDGPDYSAYIYQNSPNASVAARALEHLSTAPSLLDPRGGTTPGRGNAGGGGAGSPGQSPVGDSAGGDPISRQLGLTTGEVNSRSAQELDRMPIDGLVAAEMDRRSDTELADMLIGEGGPYVGGSRRDALNSIQKLKETNPGITSGQAAYLLANNTRGEAGPIVKALGYIPSVAIYNRIFNDGLNVSGGGARVDSTGIEAQAGLVDSPAYRQQIEASLDRQDQQGELARLEQARNNAMQRLEQASQLDRVTGGNSQLVNEEENLQRLNEEIQAGVAQTRNDPRFGRLIQDPDNPSGTITEGQLRQRRLREAEARIPSQIRKLREDTAGIPAEIMSQELQSAVQRLQAEFRELLQNPGQGKPGDLARVQAELRKAQDELNKHSRETR